MKKMVFMNPLVLFIIYFLVCIFAIILSFIADANIVDTGALVLGYISFLLLLVISFFWLYAVYKYLARQNKNRDTYDPNRFDKILLVLLLFAPAFVVADASLRDTAIHSDFSFVFELLEGSILLLFFGTLGFVLWSIAKMLKGGIGWFIALFYWPVCAVFVQNEIKELYPEASL